MKNSEGIQPEYITKWSVNAYQASQYYISVQSYGIMAAIGQGEANFFLSNPIKPIFWIMLPHV